MTRPVRVPSWNGQNKYRAKRTTLDGITFASKREAERYAELRLLEKAGEITGLELQPRFPLMAKSIAAHDFNWVQVGTYVADFRYRHTGSLVVEVEDVKSPATRTPLYKLKKKLVEVLYGITVRETS